MVLNRVTNNDEKVIGQGIIAKCQLDGLNPFSDCDRQEAANGIVAEADKVVGDISKYSWETAVRRIGQLASEMGRSMGGQSISASNGNADELTNWDGTKKRGLGI